MKTFSYLTIIFTIAFTLNVTDSEAQRFIGGDARFTFSNETTDQYSFPQGKSKDYSINVSPHFGKYFAEKFAIGLALDFSYAASNSEEPISESKTWAAGVNPFLRCYVIKWNKLSVFGQANLGFAASSISRRSGAVITLANNGINLYFTVVPGIEYDISEKFALQTSINMFSLGYSFTKIHDGSDIMKTSDYIIGAGLDNIINTGNITIGGIYKF